MNNIIILNIVGLSFNFFGGIILGYTLIRKNEDIFYGSRNIIDYSMFTDKVKVQKVKNKFIAYYKQNEKDFENFYKSLGEELQKDDYKEFDKFLNIFEYVSSRKSRLKGIWGISLLTFGFLLQIISVLLSLLK